MVSKAMLDKMPWKDIQALAKANGVKANQTREAVVLALAAKPRLKKATPAPPPPTTQRNSKAKSKSKATDTDAEEQRLAAETASARLKVMRRMGMAPRSPVKGTVRAQEQAKARGGGPGKGKAKAKGRTATAKVVDGSASDDGAAAASSAQDVGASSRAPADPHSKPKPKPAPKSAPKKNAPAGRTKAQSSKAMAGAAKTGAAVDAEEVLKVNGHLGNAPPPAKKSKVAARPKVVPTPKSKAKAKVKAGKRPVDEPLERDVVEVGQLESVDAEDLAEEEEVELLTSFAVDSDSEEDEDEAISGPILGDLHVGSKRKAVDEDVDESEHCSPKKRARKL